MLSTSERKVTVSMILVCLLLVSSAAFAGSISGQVTKHVGGSSLEGVWVQLHQGTDPYIADEHAWDWVTSVDTNPVYTDANGEYQFTGLAERRYHVYIYDQEISGTHYFEANLYNVQVFSGINTPNMDIELRQAGLIYGYVRTAGGVPIPNAEVITEATWTQYGSDWHTEWTDQAGRYEFWVAPSPGKFYPIWVREASLDGIFYETRWDGNFYRATIAGTHGPDYLLEVGGTVTGRVINEDAVGIEGVWVESQWNKYQFDSGSWTETNSNGYFELNGLPSGTNYIYVDNSWRETEQDGVKYQVGETHAGPLNIIAGQTVDVNDFTIYEAGMITGVVTDEAGFPVVAAEVEVEGKDINGEWADREDIITDAFGQFTLDYVAPGTYVFECSKDGFLTTKIIDVRVSRGGQVDLDVVLKHASEGATISGAITNYSAVAAYDSENNVHYPYYDDNDYEEFGLPEFELLAVRMDKTYTDEDYLDPDRFIIEWIDDDKIDDGYGDYFENDGNETPGHYETSLPAGDIAIGMSIYQDFLPGWGGCVILHDWKRYNLTKGDSIENVNFTATTTNTGTLNGDITVPSGYTNFPEEWCLIYAYGLDEDNHIKNAIPLGDAVAFPGWTTTYEFRNLPAGKYMLKAYATNLPSILISSVTVTADSTTPQAIDFTATSSCTLTGHITSGASDVSGAVVTIEENGRQTVTNASGVYTITGINEGTYTVKVSASGYTDAEESVSINAGPPTTQDFSLNSNVGSIFGTVKDTDANNINGATVVAYNETDDTFKTAETVGGTFSFTGLTLGSYILAVNTDEYGVVVYPPNNGRIILSAGNRDVDDANITVETFQPPVFTVSSSASNNVPVILCFGVLLKQRLGS